MASLLEQISIHAFIQNNGIKTESGQPIEFKDHMFLFDIYRDDSRNICCTKCAQIGFTTTEIVMSLWQAYYKKMDIIYVLPSVADVKIFSGGKTNRIIDNNPVFQHWAKDKDTVEQKQIGDNIIYYRGAWTERAAISVSADKLILDEYDRCKPEILEMYESRLQASKHKEKAIFSNPSIPDFGVDKYWKMSDQMEWNVKHDCGESFPMHENCINYEKEIYQCPHCLGEITDDQRRHGFWYSQKYGEWTKKADDKVWRGYWIPLWILPSKSAGDIADYKRTKSPEYFANFVAGQAYIGGGNKLTAPQIETNLTQAVNMQDGQVVIGVDPGLPTYFVIGNKDGLFYYGDVGPLEVEEKMEYFLNRWKNSIMMIDQGGDLMWQRKLQAKYPNRVFLCWFRKDSTNQQMVKWGEKEEHGKVVIDRNRVIQQVVDEIVDSRLPLHYVEDPSEWNEYVLHWMNIYRIKDMKDENAPEYGWRYVWERSGPDHLAMATIYYRVGIDKYNGNKGVIVRRNANNWIQGEQIW